MTNYARNYRHGHKPNSGGSRTYTAWVQMYSRCCNPRNGHYSRYGGRGIAICSRWVGSSGFVNFLSDMGEKPPGLTLGRIDNDGGYDPRNCRWETPAQQAHNRRSSRLTERDVIAIFRLKPSVRKSADGITPSIAKQFCVSVASVYKIWDGTNWASVTRNVRSLGQYDPETDPPPFAAVRR